MQNFKPGPSLQSLPPETKQSSEGEAAPKRRGRPPGSKNRNTRASLKTEIGGTLTIVNTALAFSPFAKDALDPIEIEALATALDEECKRSASFRRYVEYMTRTVSGGGSLLGVVAIIGVRRAARHNIVPAQFDSQLGGLLAMSIGKPAPPTPPNTEGA